MGSPIYSMFRPTQHVFWGISRLSLLQRKRTLPIFPLQASPQFQVAQSQHLQNLQPLTILWYLSIRNPRVKWFALNASTIWGDLRHHCQDIGRFHGSQCQDNSEVHPDQWSYTSAVSSALSQKWWNHHPALGFHRLNHQYIYIYNDKPWHRIFWNHHNKADQIPRK